ncbi:MULTISPECIES: hypothetical protein [Methylobacterium]|uniref:hypothetical protein n=1 Tax=Methylobacterium TaxID=407 RepID=UPI00104E9C1D|nr:MULTISPECIES: hypothetical protein [Methylobacterium]MDR7035619.1 hypothetical protein [Methylobacterium sp. BE186]
MLKMPTDRKPEARRPTLSAGVRRHLGLSLQAFYADALSAPASPRLEAVLARFLRRPEIVAPPSTEY